MLSRASLGGSGQLDFELPFTSKLLLLAAYLCSRNRPALDRRLFDPSSRTGRRRSTMASDRQARPGTPCSSLIAACMTGLCMTGHLRSACMDYRQLYLLGRQLETWVQHPAEVWQRGTHSDADSK